jgi:hypothetical protein
MMCEVLVQLFSLLLFIVALLYEGFEQGGWNLKHAKGVQLCQLKVDIDKMPHIFDSLDC